MDAYKYNKKIKNIKNYYKQKTYDNKQRSIYIKLINNDIIYRLVNSLVNRANQFINIKDINLSHLELIGCTHLELKIHIESQFKNGMTFDNYGDWELDHIYPISKFNLNDINEVKKCFNYKNIQPLWKLENIKKSNKIINEHSEYLK